MVIFHSYVKLPEGTVDIEWTRPHKKWSVDQQDWDLLVKNGDMDMTNKNLAFAHKQCDVPQKTRGSINKKIGISGRKKYDLAIENWVLAHFSTAKFISRNDSIEDWDWKRGTPWSTPPSGGQHNTWYPPRNRCCNLNHKAIKKNGKHMQRRFKKYPKKHF